MHNMCTKNTGHSRVKWNIYTLWKYLLSCGYICIDTQVKVYWKQKLNTIAILLILHTFFVIPFTTVTPISALCTDRRRGARKTRQSQTANSSTVRCCPLVSHREHTLLCEISACPWWVTELHSTAASPVPYSPICANMASSTKKWKYTTCYNADTGGQSYGYT